MTISSTVFLATVATVAFLILRAIATRRVLSLRIRAAVCAAILVGWIAIPATLALQGMLNRYAPWPPPAMFMVMVLTAATIGLTASPVGAALSDSLGLPSLVGYQAFRIPVEWWLHRLFEDGAVPIQMTYAGRNLDVITGVTALVLALWLVVAHPPRWVVFAWNLVGLALLINIIAVSALSTPAVHYFLNGPPNLLLSGFPSVWLPSFLVQAALAGHVLVFRAWLRGSAPRPA